ncbi:uncharacterized protein H6S33_000869 [Morchella sextelata]|uniref:uncharacterized protein n=1 Tax=Morchella sextelata TaxID=1174677 RepID=UPI001D035F9B|nr:uncharacterized protein H6S33_000869 [Morchella sextelata]KAH0615233.1 hypothetical protein H6S33_000869 [Morchella sextelata]
MTINTTTYEKTPWPIELLEKPSDSEPESESDSEPKPESKPTFSPHDGRYMRTLLPVLDAAFAAESVGNVGAVSDSSSRDPEADAGDAAYDTTDLASWRTWTDVTGEWRTVALFLGSEDDGAAVRIRRRDGVEVVVDVERLGVGDRGLVAMESES